MSTSAAMLGSATFTAEMSRITISCARHSSHSTAPERAWGSVGEGCRCGRWALSRTLMSELYTSQTPVSTFFVMAHGDAHHHHDLPTAGRALTTVSISATLHCLTGCALGEIVGMAIGTAAGLSNWGTVALSVALAFVFGYSLTSLPLLRAGLALAAVVPIALASDTFSILTMEIVDNLILVAIPGALHAGLGDLLFWGSLSFSLSIAFLFAVPVNRWLIARGRGHVAVHETGIHGGPPPPPPPRGGGGGLCFWPGGACGGGGGGGIRLRNGRAGGRGDWLAPRHAATPRRRTSC